MKDPGGKKLLPTNVTEITFASAWILTCQLSSLALCMIVVHCNSLPLRIPLAPSRLSAWQVGITRLLQARPDPSTTSFRMWRLSHCRDSREADQSLTAKKKSKAAITHAPIGGEDDVDFNPIHRFRINDSSRVIWPWVQCRENRGWRNLGCGKDGNSAAPAVAAD